MTDNIALKTLPFPETEIRVLLAPAVLLVAAPQTRIPLPYPLHNGPCEFIARFRMEGYNGAIAEEEDAHGLNSNRDTFATFELF